jgi:hypothetical protein
MCLSFDGFSQAKQGQKKKSTSSAEPAGNAGDPKNAEAGRDNKGESETNKNSDNDPLLGEENDDAPGTQSTTTDNADYRNNRVSGNPNNTNVNEGSNRKNTETRETNESSGSVQLDSVSSSNQPGQEGSGSTTSENTQADPDASNVPAVMQENSSQSGSPAVLSGEEGSDRDGTNNVQRAKPNMAGSKVKGMHYGKGKDTDREIREGTKEQQKESVGNDVSRSRNKNQQGRRQREMNSNRSHTKNPHPRNTGAPADRQPGTDESNYGNNKEADDDRASSGQSENDNISEQENHDQMMNDRADQNQKDKKKKKRWFRRNKD